MIEKARELGNENRRKAKPVMSSYIGQPQTPVMTPQP